jgi:hypothetical protein
MPSALAFAEPTWNQTRDGFFIPSFESESTKNCSIGKKIDSAPHPSTISDSKRSTLTEQVPSVERRRISALLSKPISTINSNKTAESLGHHCGAFQIYDEYCESKVDDQRSKAQDCTSAAKPSEANQMKETISGSINDVITKAFALTISDSNNGRVELMSNNALSSAEKRKVPPIPTADNLALELMHSRLCVFFERGLTTEVSTDCKRRGGGRISVWVIRYVDYTSKYGLGFLLNNGSAGVYFNDSTKAVVASDGETFQYIERRKHSSSSLKSAPDCEIHKLTSFPDSLKKKVTLLKHFCGYLLEQQKRSDEVETRNDLEVSEACDTLELVYLTKWVRTRHAIFFRLSDGTVQIVFFDQTEVMLSSDISNLVYVDKTQNRTSMLLDISLMESHPDIAKRLKYAKDILHQLVHGGKG